MTFDEYVKLQIPPDIENEINKLYGQLRIIDFRHDSDEKIAEDIEYNNNILHMVDKLYRKGSEPNEN